MKKLKILKLSRDFRYLQKLALNTATLRARDRRTHVGGAIHAKRRFNFHSPTEKSNRRNAFGTDLRCTDHRKRE